MPMASEGSDDVDGCACLTELRAESPPAAVAGHAVQPSVIVELEEQLAETIG